MSVNITIREGGEARNLTAGKLKTNLYGGGTCLWVPEDDVGLESKTIRENGTYKASDDGYYGFSQVKVNVPGGKNGPPGGKGSAVVGKKANGNDALITVDENGDIAEVELPSSIAVTTPPEDTHYADQEAIDYAGMVVKAYKADGALWTSDAYPDGVIPVSGLTLPAAADINAVVRGQEYPEYQESGTVTVTGVGSLRRTFDDAISHFNGTVADGGIFENYIYPKLDMYEGEHPGVVHVYRNAPQNFSGWSPIDIYIFTGVEVGDDLALGNRGIPETVISFAAQGSGGTLRIVDYSVGTTSSLFTMVTTGQSEGSGYYSASSVNASVSHFGQQPLAICWARPGDGKILTAETYVTVTERGEE